MRAWLTGPDMGIDALRMVERPDPRPGMGEALVKVRAVSLNYRDLLVIEGHSQWRPTGPRIPVSDGAGEIVAVGDGVTRVRVGDRVASVFFPNWMDGPLDAAKIAVTGMGGRSVDGMLAEYRALPERALVHLPEHLSFEEGATLPVAALTAWNSVIEQGGTQLGDTILTQGTGGVALFALQFALLAGARVIALSSTPEKIARLSALGAGAVINYREMREWDSLVREATGGEGVNQVVDILGGALDRSLRSTRVGGLISLVGNLAGFAATFDIRNLSAGARIQDVAVGSRAMFERMNHAIAQHELRPVIDRVFAFEDAPAALYYLKSGQHIGKVCITVTVGT